MVWLNTLSLLLREIRRKKQEEELSMGGFFSFDNPVFHVINKIVDMIIISMIYLIVCIPIITIGPATSWGKKVTKNPKSNIFETGFINPLYTSHV